jgi:hypothetical protein
MGNNYHLEKAKSLVNKFYAESESQLEAIRRADEAVYTSLCQRISVLHRKSCDEHKYTLEQVNSYLDDLKYWQLVAAELQNLRRTMSV